MRAFSIAALAVAVVAASASATSPEVEPVALTTTTTTAPAEPQVIANSSPLNTTSNSTSDRKIGVQGRWCKGMLNANWNEYKYACTWVHSPLFYSTYWNQFFMKWNGDVVQQCNCDNSLLQYEWGQGQSTGGWTYSVNNGVICYARDGRTDGNLQHEFDNYGCS